MVWGLNPGAGVIFYISPDRPGAHPASYTMGTSSLPGVKRPGCGVYRPPTSSAEVNKRVELHLYFPSGPSWPVLEYLQIIVAIKFFMFKSKKEYSLSSSIYHRYGEIIIACFLYDDIKVVVHRLRITSNAVTEKIC
jgi:hypothetical protein